MSGVQPHSRGRMRTRIGSLALLATTVLIAAGCGDLSSGDSTSLETTSADAGQSTRPATDLPARPDGVVQIEGQIGGSITDEVVAAFPSYTADAGLAVRAEAVDTSSELGIAALCAGRVDIAATSRLITDAEVGECARNGLKVVDFQIAFDAIVVATRNERDIGGDCVNLDQLRAMFGADAPATSWNQLNPNFALLRIDPAGPGPDSSDFGFFGARVLGVPNPTLANFTPSYHVLPSEVEVKDYVVHQPPGAVGLVGFSLYELFEDKLRPLEIDGQTGDRCVFPSAETISSELYPLERTLRLYTTNRSIRRPEVKTYIRFHLEQAGDFAKQLDLVPLPSELLNQELGQLDGKSSDSASSQPGASTTPESSSGSTTTAPSQGSNGG
jgi:ABC-type phosphate transport system substrate-binding protein